MGRFINADDLSLIGSQAVCCSNSYNYCHNNVVNYIDPTGYYEGVLSGNTFGLILNELSNALAYIMASIAASIAGLKTAIRTAWMPLVCLAAATIAVVGIVCVFNIVKNLTAKAEQVKAKVRERANSQKGKNPHLNDNIVYVILSNKDNDVVYVGITKNYSARNYYHQLRPGAKFPIASYTMVPIAWGLSRIQARTMEQTIITAFTLKNLRNIINSINEKKWRGFTDSFEKMLNLILSWADPE